VNGTYKAKYVIVTFYKRDLAFKMDNLQGYFAYPVHHYWLDVRTFIFSPIQAKVYNEKEKKYNIQNILETDKWLPV
jgi:hypothetical protein